MPKYPQTQLKKNPFKPNTQTNKQKKLGPPDPQTAQEAESA